MGLRSRLRAKRDKFAENFVATESAQQSVAPEATREPSSMSTGPATLVATSGERTVEPLATIDEVKLPKSPRRLKRFSRDSRPSFERSTAPSSNSARTSLLDAASRMRRTLRKKVLLKRPESDGLSTASRDPADIPEISDADVRIAEYAAACENNSEDQTSSDPMFPRIPHFRGVSSGDLVPLGADVPCGNRCNDGYVSFIVPTGWIATRMADSFCLFTDRAVGFVRTTRANEAAKALLETERLQVVAAVTPLSSPIFVSDDEIQVSYSSHAGSGTGLAKFAEGDGACVFALCGPIEMESMIQRSLQDLRTSVSFMSIPADRRVGADESRDTNTDSKAATAREDSSKQDAARCSIQ